MRKHLRIETVLIVVLTLMVCVGAVDKYDIYPLACDKINQLHYPGIKLVEGADGFDDGFIAESNPLPVEVFAGGARVQSSDLFDSLVVTESNVIELHRGRAFLSDAKESNGGMGIGDTFILAFKTAPGTGQAYFATEMSTLTGGHTELLEAPTWTTATGTQNPIHNRKREMSMNMSGFLEDTGGSFLATDNLILNPTGLSGGTIIHHLYAWGKKEKSGGGAGDTGV